MKNQKLGYKVLRDFIIVLTVSQYNLHLAQHFPPMLSLTIGIAGVIFLVLFFIDTVGWVRTKINKGRPVPKTAPQDHEPLTHSPKSNHSAFIVEPTPANQRIHAKTDTVILSFSKKQLLIVFLALLIAGVYMIGYTTGKNTSIRLESEAIRSTL